MVKIWSEPRAPRLREQFADLATLLWIVAWGAIAWQLFQLLAGYADTGRVIRDAGGNLIQGGQDLATLLARVPLVGASLGDVARTTFSGAGQPLSDVGADLEQFILLISAALGLLVALVMLVPWLAYYLPWRWARLRRLRAAHRAIRMAPRIDDATLERLLAMRAISRLDYESLLAHTPDPFGDWQGGRLDRLARAELASVGLRPR